MAEQRSEEELAQDIREKMESVAAMANELAKTDWIVNVELHSNSAFNGIPMAYRASVCITRTEVL